jgi:leucyl aminopeptidase
MIDLPDFQPLKVTQNARPPTRQVLDTLDHVAIVLPKNPRPELFRALPQGKQLAKLLKRASAHGMERVSSRIGNARATGITLASAPEGSAFEILTWARQLIAECVKDSPAKLGLFVSGLSDTAHASVMSKLVAAACASAFELPSFKTEKKGRPARIRNLTLLAVKSRIELAETLAAATGNNAARWFTALPPNELTAASYREAVRALAKGRALDYQFLDERKLASLGAGAFLAVAQGNAGRDAGIMRVSYRPSREKQAELALVGKGILFDTGGTNLKPFKSMLDMHIDMQGSAVALGTLLALVELEVPYAVDLWLAVTENRLSPNSYKSQDVVRAANGTTIQVIHTDAEGRMVLADTLALASRESPKLIIDYATLTGSCVSAVTERYSGAFTNRASATPLLIEAGAASGERVWPFPMDADFDEALQSDVADIKQCSAENQGDHILGARFLSRFVPATIPWIHVDLSAGQHRGGLAHVPSEITGFGVNFTLELLRRQSQGPAALAEKLAT